MNHETLEDDRRGRTWFWRGRQIHQIIKSKVIIPYFLANDKVEDKRPEERDEVDIHLPMSDVVVVEEQGKTCVCVFKETNKRTHRAVFPPFTHIIPSRNHP